VGRLSSYPWVQNPRLKSATASGSDRVALLLVLGRIVDLQAATNHRPTSRRLRCRLLWSDKEELYQSLIEDKPTDISGPRLTIYCEAQLSTLCRDTINIELQGNALDVNTRILVLLEEPSNRWLDQPGLRFLFLLGIRERATQRDDHDLGIQILLKQYQLLSRWIALFVQLPGGTVIKRQSVFFKVQ